MGEIEESGGAEVFAFFLHFRVESFDVRRRNEIPDAYEFELDLIALREALDFDDELRFGLCSVMGAAHIEKSCCCALGGNAAALEDERVGDFAIAGEEAQIREIAASVHPDVLVEDDEVLLVRCDAFDFAHNAVAFAGGDLAEGGQSERADYYESGSEAAAGHGITPTSC